LRALIFVTVEKHPLIGKKQQHESKVVFNPLSSGSDECLISTFHVAKLSNIQVMRVKEIIIKIKFLIVK